MARKKKFYKKRQPKERFRINKGIRVPEVRLVGDNLDELSDIINQKIEPGRIHKTYVAQQWADEMELDLIEISPNASPPVVQILDYKKFLYDKKKREKEIRAKAIKTVVKEIRFGPNTDDHDFDFKVRHAKNFLEEGSKVRAYVHFRGRTIVFKDRGELLLLRFLKELNELGAAEDLPKMEGRRMSVMVAPKKGKKSSDKEKKESEKV